jgi:molybdopterin-biosynthesis enzyme MoeA-like protein
MFDALEPSLPAGVPIAMRAVHGFGVMEGNIAAGLTEIARRYPALDLGSYPFRRDDRGGVAIVAKGTDVAALEAAIAEAGILIAAQDVPAVAGEPA